MIDIYCIAKNFKQNPINSWWVRTYPNDITIAEINYIDEYFYATVGLNQPTQHLSLVEARDWLAEWFSKT